MKTGAENILNLIKRRASIRKYTDKPIPKDVLDKILEAGVWGPSVPSFLAIQPWKFIVVTNREKIDEISMLISQQAKKSKVGVNILVNSASKIIQGSSAVVFVCNSKDLDKLKGRYKQMYSNFAAVIKPAQISAISAAVQNMILVAEAFGVGSCWLDTPLFCKKEIAASLGSINDLQAVLTFGYPAHKGKRSKRKPVEEMLEFIR